MMVKEKMTVHRNGVTFNGWHYYNEALYGIDDYVIGKYSLSDFSKIYCFYKNEPLCIAEPIEQAHPMASEAEPPKDHEAVKRVAALKSKLRRGTKNLLNLIESGQGTNLGDSFRRSPEVAEVVKAIEDKRKPTKIISAFLDEEDDAIPEASVEVPKDEIIIDPETDLSKSSIFVDPRTGLSRPSDGTIFKEEFEYYDWYRAIEEKYPGTLNNTDWRNIERYEATEDWKDYYGRIGYARMTRTIVS
jgi:hypothetical protein